MLANQQLFQRIDSIKDIDRVQVKEFLRDNDYGKVVDLEERFFNIARFYQNKINQQEIYIEIDEAYVYKLFTRKNFNNLKSFISNLNNCRCYHRKIEYDA